MRPTSRRFHGDLRPWVAVVLLALFMASQYGDASDVPFINDDFLFLDKTRGASFLALWAPDALAFNWYRPWSRELHYWMVQGLFGPRELPFHVASFVLALGGLTGYFVLVRRIATTRIAAMAVAGWAALAAWAVPMLWIAGVQELWMLVFAMLTLHAVAADRRRYAAVWLVLALLSKESAALLPAVAVAFEALVRHRSWFEATRRHAPLWGITVVWAFLHPQLGGRLWRPLADAAPAASTGAWPLTLGRTLAMPLNLDAWPAPEGGWAPTLARGLVGAALLVVLVLWSARPVRRVGATTPTGLARFGMVWALAGWAPLLMPGLGWHAYYALFGAAGAWLAIAASMARYPLVASALVVGLAVLRSARADTPSLDWGDEWYQRRAASFLRVMRSDLLEQVPRPAPHTRFYFVRVPSNVGFLAGDAPALRVWYRDPTLRGGFYPSYRVRLADEPQGPDLFFRFDSTAGWVSIRPGREDMAQAQAANPRWATDHQVLAQTFARADNWGGALAEYLKMAGADSLDVESAFNIGVCYEALGDSLNAARWHLRAAALPGADEEMRAVARQYEEHIRGSRDLRGGSSRPNP